MSHLFDIYSIRASCRDAGLDPCRNRAALVPYGDSRVTDSRSYVRLPAALSDRLLAVIPPAINDDEFAAHQTEFIRHIFGYCEYLKEHARESPVSDAFLAVFVNLFEALHANAPDDARRCTTQLLTILRALVPGIEIDDLDRVDGVDGDGSLALRETSDPVHKPLNDI
jgi:hypothetical protein